MRQPLRPVTSVELAKADSESNFSFAVMGETRPTLPGMPHPPIAHAVMREIALLRPALVLCTGDVIWGFQNTRQEMLNELDRFRSLANTCGVPLFNAPGNHEIQSRHEWQELLPEWGHDLYGSFDLGAYHFIALNTEEVNREGRVTGEQLEWLESDLAANATSAGIFVFLHRPLFSWFQGNFNEDDSEALQRLFRVHPVRAVFSAHDHFYYEEVHDGVRYFTIGGGGAPAYTQPPAGGFAHYLLVEVSPEEIDFRVIEPNRVQVFHLSGNDGLAPVSSSRVANTTDRDLTVRNLELRAPRLTTHDRYQASGSFIDFARRRVDVPVEVRAVTDLGDGSVAVALQLDVPTGTAISVTLDAQENPDIRPPAEPG